MRACAAVAVGAGNRAGVGSRKARAVERVPGGGTGRAAAAIGPGVSADRPITDRLSARRTEHPTAAMLFLHGDAGHAEVAHLRHRSAEEEASRAIRLVGRGLSAPARAAILPVVLTYTLPDGVCDTLDPR